LRIRRVLRVAAGVTDGGGGDAGHLAERILDAPEAPGGERRELVAGPRYERRAIADLAGIGADLCNGLRAVRARVGSFPGAGGVAPEEGQRDEQDSERAVHALTMPPGAARFRRTKKANPAAASGHLPAQVVDDVDAGDEAQKAVVFAHDGDEAL